MSFCLCFGSLILSLLILNEATAFEGDINGIKNEFSLKNIKKLLPSSKSDEFDCVDIYKQPAFDHPKLRNHTIQLNPSFLKYSKKSSWISSCPPGKVPIAKARASYPGNLQSVEGHHYGEQLAVVESGPGYTLHGVRSLIELHDPRPVENSQYSMASIWVLAGPKSEFNSLQAGWGVHRSLYKDSDTHLTIYWTIDNFEQTGCFNTLCPGFVQTHPSFYPGRSYPPDAVEEGKHNVIDVTIFQDEVSGNWWLTFNGGIGVGYWPKEILTHLAEKATQVRYGGWAFNKPSEPAPPMGNGNIPTGDLQKSSFFADLRVYNGSFAIERSSTLSMSTIVDSPNCYNAIYLPNQGGDKEDLFTYGGPGGATC